MRAAVSSTGGLSVLVLKARYSMCATVSLACAACLSLLLTAAAPWQDLPQCNLVSHGVPGLLVYAQLKDRGVPAPDCP